MRNFLEFIPQTDDIDLSRIDRFQKKMSNRVASICSERAVLYTESFKQTEGEPYILRKAKAFAHTLAHMTVYIESDSLIFGNQASSNFAAPVFPEFSIDWSSMNWMEPMEPLLLTSEAAMSSSVLSR